MVICCKVKRVERGVNRATTSKKDKKVVLRGDLEMANLPPPPPPAPAN